MINLAYTPDEIKEEVVDASPTAPSNVPKYPYGLTIYLDEDVLTKLGKTINDFKSGDTMTMPTAFRVTGISSNENSDGTTSDCVNLQITGFDIKPPSTDAEKAARIYNK